MKSASYPCKEDDYNNVRERLFDTFPETREQWSDTEVKRSVALMLATLRMTCGLSQADICKRTGWNKAFVSRLEGATGSIPDTKTIKRYTDSCGAFLGLVVCTPSSSGSVEFVGSSSLSSSPEMGAFLSRMSTQQAPSKKLNTEISSHEHVVATKRRAS